MLSSLQGRRPKPRRFQYEPRFYDPSKDEAARGRLHRRIRIERTMRPRVKSRQPAFILVGLLLVAAFLVYVYIDRVVDGAASLTRLFFGG